MLRDVVMFLPETCMLLGALLTFAVSVLRRSSERPVWIMPLLTALAALVAGGLTLRIAGEPFFPGIYRVDLFSQLIKTGLALGLALVLLLSRDLESVRPGARADAPLFLMLSTVGMMLLVSATELLTIYVALELAAYGLYLAVAVHRDALRGSEAGARYVLMGGAASAVTLYGFSLIYGATGSTYLGDVQQVIAQGQGGSLAMVGLLLFLAALFFKLAVFPFHFWAPDVYQGAPHQMVAFVATASKLGAIGILARMFSLLLPAPAGGVELLMVVSVAAMSLGNLAAIGQSDLKRLLAYSAIAHAGYVMLGFDAFSSFGLAAAIFYGVIYVAMALLAFVVICALGDDGSNPTLDSLTGLYHRSPTLALMLLTAMFALAGIPPTAGFVGKWFLFAAAMEQGHLTLVLIAAGNATVALYYYLRVIKAAYLQPAPDAAPIPLKLSHRVAGYLALALVLIAGIYPAPLWDMAQRAASVLM